MNRSWKRLTKDSMNISKYYRFTEPENPHPKAVVMKKGTRIEGKFMDRQQRGEYVSFIVELDNGELVSVPRTKAIEDALSLVEKGSLVAITYNGKKKLKGGKTFHQIDVDLADATPIVEQDEELM